MVLQKLNVSREKTNMPPPSDKKKVSAAERKRKERERIRQDPEKYALMKAKEKERSRKRREQKKIPSINDLSERGKRKQRAEWRKRYHRHAKNKRQQQRNEEFVADNSPPASVNGDELQVEMVLGNQETNKCNSRKKRLRRSRDKYRKKIKQLENQLKHQKKKTDKWKKKHSRVVHKQKTEVIKTFEDNNNIESEVQQRRKGNLQSKRKKNNLRPNNIRMLVHKFLVDDENSYLTPGRKDTITRRKIKKQLRYLTDTMLVLHKRFVSSQSIKISYQHFCKLKPFWVVNRPTNKRDTCMCKYHENFSFLFQKCKQYKAIQYVNLNDLLNTICCDITKKACMYRECPVCKSKNISFNQNCDVPLDSSIFHYEWKTLQEERIKNGQMRAVKVTKKVKVQCTIQTLQNKLSSQLLLFMKHKFRIHNQCKFSKYVRNNLNDDEVFLVVDFSENYQLKYASEIQSRHFGASNEQLSLHTGAYFAKIMTEDSSKIKVKTFCTVSCSNRHDAAAIWAHLLPIFKKIKEDHENITRVHIMSDGPTKQYRNKTNMFLFSHYMEELGFEIGSYNFSEAGHGKSIADGVGGTIKRTADSAVRLGKDVANIDEFMASVSNLRPLVLQVEETSITEVDVILKSHLKNLIPIKNTMMLHQVIWKNQHKQTSLNCRFLSCIWCRNKKNCSHQFTYDHNLIVYDDTNSSTPSTSCILLNYILNKMYPFKTFVTILFYFM